MVGKSMSEVNPPIFLTRFPTLLAGLAMVTIIFIMSIVKGEFGDLGYDNDDIMRLVQIRDFLGTETSKGQSWFDTNQYRLGLPGGTNMHWSRIPDIPIVILTHVFDLFTDRSNALRWAYTIWPPFSALILICAMATGARFWAHSSVEKSFGTNKVYVFTLVLLAFFVFRFYRFIPGAIDHHNVQMGLVALAMVCAVDPKSRFLVFFISGFATALSLAVGVEVYIFAAIICTFIALNWAIQGDSVSMGTQGFGVGLAGGLALAFFGTIAPSEYSIIACDALSLITLSAGVVGGLGLALVARLLPSKDFKVRIIGLAVLGAVCLFVLSRQAPQCLANPLSALPDEVNRLWLSNVSEAKPLSLSMKNAAMIIPYMLGAPLLALVILCRHYWKVREWSPRLLVFMLLIGALGLTFYQRRFFPFAYVVAILPLAGWINHLYERGAAAVRGHIGDEGNPSNIAYIGALAVSVPLIWSVPGLMLTQDMKEAAVTKASCYSADVMDALNTLPVGLVAATSNGGAPILQFTPHRALSGNYHRNIAGISAQIKIATSNPNDSVLILRQHNVDYVHFCRPSLETESLLNENPNGLYGMLQAGNVPHYLEAAVPDIEDGAVSIYRVVQ